MVKSGLVSKIVGVAISATLSSCQEIPKVGYSIECSQYVQKENDGYKQVCEQFTNDPGDHILFKMILDDRDVRLLAYDCDPRCEEWSCYKSKEGKYFMYIEKKCETR
jgi:hypothetical protein